MEKLDPKTDGATMDIVGQNIEKIKELFPDIFTEDKINFDILREELGNYVDDQEERYSFIWNGKARARQISQTQSTGTLRPCPEESVSWDTTQNIFIEGDNLEVLKLMQKSYHKKVKMIYIDPPYNTGKEFIYPDRFQDNLDTYLRYTGQKNEEGLKLSANTETSGRYHTNWLNMMLPRLKLARNLLSDDGMIFISIDDNELANLRKICDEIFGAENFIDNIIWKKRYGGGAKEKYLVTLHEYILTYAKNIGNIDEIYIPLSEENIKRYYKLTDDNYPVRGPYRTHPLEAGAAVDERPNLIFSITAPDGTEINPKRQWYWNKERVELAIKNGEIEFIKDSSGEWTVHSKQYLKDENGNIRQAKAFSIIDDVYSQHGTNEVIDIFGNAKIFPYPKPTNLIVQLIKIGLKDNDGYILDFFAGSGTIAHAVFDLNKEDGGTRKFIMIQLPEPCDEESDAFKAGYKSIAEIGKERIRRVIKKLKAEQIGDSLWQDLGFKILKLDSSNIKPWDADFDDLETALFDAVENIKPDRIGMDILYELLLKYGLELTVPIEERIINGKTVYIIGAGALIVCLAKEIGLDVVGGIAALKEELKPEVIRVVFRDAGFKDDVVKTNAVQILRQVGIEDVKSL